MKPEGTINSSNVRRIIIEKLLNKFECKN